MKLHPIALVLLLLAACATPPGQQATGPAAVRAGAEKELGDAVVAPLTDLNLLRVTIPPVLVEAKKAPYATPADLSCAALAAEVEALDAALGEDLDAAASTATVTLVQRGTDAAGNAVIGAVRRTTEGVLPFRSWVRKLTGAERHAREVAAAIDAGTVRRAFLKGLGAAAGCAPPAAPWKAPLTSDTVGNWRDGSGRITMDPRSQHLPPTCGERSAP
ncbi:MAG TPA: twin-arginine translocation signal domain-containing protein [Ramlibacter sp.]|uniref:twin-arginine translocation signal domain-containing protein n=1 Tax=Ramlibacter sp. TaxID=1917967 RepID=UPI002D7FE215|nr:twin-arginine translocation signal domain-containing protein [Ramlibacter sp.]HET8748689.1 twin-arginine translocation signal domain-containing protein [Ramlibacter sp.]